MGGCWEGRTGEMETYPDDLKMPYEVYYREAFSNKYAYICEINLNAIPQ